MTTDEQDGKPVAATNADEASATGSETPGPRADGAEEVGERVGPGEPDPNDLVGPGKFPLRIQPAAAIMPGTADSKRLLSIWFVRKSFYWLFFLGISIGLLTTAFRHQSDIDVEVTSPSALVSPWAVLAVALIVRFVSGWVALGFAFPLALAHEPNLSPRTNFGSGIGKFFDRLHIARAFRSLRWTHHVRQVAQHRLGPTGARAGKLDPIFDIINISSGVIAFISLVIFTIVAPG